LLLRKRSYTSNVCSTSSQEVFGYSIEHIVNGVNSCLIAHIVSEIIIIVGSVLTVVICLSFSVLFVEILAMQEVLKEISRLSSTSMVLSRGVGIASCRKLLRYLTIHLDLDLDSHPQN